LCWEANYFIVMLRIHNLYSPAVNSFVLCSSSL
jgi:hypothetical protein